MKTKKGSRCNKDLMNSGAVKPKCQHVMQFQKHNRRSEEITKIRETVESFRKVGLVLDAMSICKHISFKYEYEQVFF